MGPLGTTGGIWTGPLYTLGNIIIRDRDKWQGVGSGYTDKGSFPIEKATKLGNLAFRGGGVIKKSKNSQVSVGKSSKLGWGGLRKSKKFQRVSKTEK